MADIRRERPPTGPLRSAAEWGQVFDTHHDAIWRYLCRRVGPTAADDLTGEVFLRALRSDTSPDPGAERAWLYGIATNLVRERARKEARHLRACARLGDPLSEGFDLEAVASRLDAQSLAAEAMAEVARMDPNDRDALLLYALTELDYAGIADATGAPIGTVRSRIHRARRQLLAVLGSDETPSDQTLREARTA